MFKVKHWPPSFGHSGIQCVSATFWEMGCHGFQQTRREKRERGRHGRALHFHLRNVYMFSVHFHWQELRPSSHPSPTH